MAIGVRDITNLEELLEVQDDDKIIVIQNGEAKLVSKANAKFGGGTVTVFYADNNDSSRIKRLLDVNGNPIGAKTAYDAVMNRPVYINYKIVNENTNMFLVPTIFGTVKNGIEIISVLFTAFNGTGNNIDFYAGANPNGGNS